MSEETYERQEQLSRVRKWNRELLLTALNEEDLRYISPRTNFQAQIEIQATLRLARVLCTSAYTDPEPDTKERKQIQVRQQVGIQKFQKAVEYDGNFVFARRVLAAVIRELYAEQSYDLKFLATFELPGLYEDSVNYREITNPPQI